MPILNLGVVAHVDAGKTTLTERLLYTTGAIRHLGRVDHGDTTTDSDALERRRGITIRSAVASFAIGDLHVNLIDTPGHSDFVAEVERALAVLDGAVLVVSAVEGVQAQTRMLIRILERLRIPFLVFANKIDRAGAAYASTMSALRSALGGEAVALTSPHDLGSRAAGVKPRADSELIEEVVEHVGPLDDELLALYAEGRRPVGVGDALAALRRRTATGEIHPVVFGSALSGVGVDDVLDAIAAYLPASHGDAASALHASVFKIERGPAGHKIGYVRMHDGTLGPRDVVGFHRRLGEDSAAAREGRVTAVSVARAASGGSGGSGGGVGAGGEERARPGDIARVVGLSDLAIGDQLGRWDPRLAGRFFAPPGLAAVVRPRDPANRSALFRALTMLSEQDPLIAARIDGPADEATVSLYGEVQREVIAARLAEEFGIEAELSATTVVHVERLRGVAEAAESLGSATVGVRLAPGRPESGITYRLGIERGWLLPSHHVAIEETLPKALAEGPRGWTVVDVEVTLIAGRFAAPTPPAGYYRELTMATVRRAVRAAGTVACAPYSSFELEAPADVVSALLHLLVSAGGTPGQPAFTGDRCLLSGTLPTGSVHGVEQLLPTLTRGEGVFTTQPAGFRPAEPAPT